MLDVARRNLLPRVARADPFLDINREREGGAIPAPANGGPGATALAWRTVSSFPFRADVPPSCYFPVGPNQPMSASGI